MADHELKYRFGPIDAVKWWLLRHNSITVPWPKEKEFVIKDSDTNWVDLGGAFKVSLYTDDPNYHFRQLLEDKVGKQGRDWMWKPIPGTTVILYDSQPDPGVLEIRFRSSKAKWASFLQMKWSRNE